MGLKDDGVIRTYTDADVEKLRGKTKIEYTLARLGSEKLRNHFANKNCLRALGALTGNQAVQQVKAGLKAIYVSGWQVAADANLSGEMYPDQSLYPSNSVPFVVKKINSALMRAEQVEKLDGNSDIDFAVPLIADAEAGFGGHLNVFEIVKSMIEAGAAAVHLEDQLASEKKCGHMGGKVLVPTGQFIKTLIAAKLAADVLDVPTVIIGRTDADSAKLLTSDIDERDHDFIEQGVRTKEGFFKLCRTGLERAVARGLAYAPFCDMLWMETSTPDLDQARAFAEAIHEKFPGKPLAYNCSPSFNWKKKMSREEAASFQNKLEEFGYLFQFVTLAGFHTLNYSMFDLASKYSNEGMVAYSDLQNLEFESEKFGYTAVKHQREVGTGYFDKVNEVISNGDSSTRALDGSTEESQF